MNLIETFKEKEKKSKLNKDFEELKMKCKINKDKSNIENDERIKFIYETNNLTLEEAFCTIDHYSYVI